MILVKTLYNTEADGTPVADGVDEEDMPTTYHGPFESDEAAEAWLSEWPDDQDVYEQYINDYDLPRGTIINTPESLFGGLPDEDVREDVEDHDLGPID